MKINHSPWLHQLNPERKLVELNNDVFTDIAIIGAGIAGISTAFFLLHHTNKKVIIVDKNKIAHGATGHNAGQVVSYFERPLYEIAEEFGNDKAAEAQRAIESAWDLLSDMYTQAGLTIPFSRFEGRSGFATFEQIEEHLKDNKFRKEMSLDFGETLISDKAPFIKSLDEYKDLFTIVKDEQILSLLETNEESFLAVSLYHKGTLNSALFSEMVASYLLKKFKNRLSIYENTHIHKAILKDEYALLDAGFEVIKAEKIILCTNGFENINIINKSGLNIDTNFHHEVTGIVARMSGYLEKYNKPPMAISYHVRPEVGFDDMDDPYYYLTRRIYEYEKGVEHNLVCIGGPQHSIADREEYLYEYDYPEEVQHELDLFIKRIYNINKNKKIDYQFTWHGLMGYTRNRIRIVGKEPKNPVLMYNLGCNGVGILPSIFGGKRIADIIAGKNIKPMIFDPL